jgi:phosphoadenosine phosphosulfate reductase
MIETLNSQIANLSAGEWVKSVLQAHPGKVCLTCSFQAEDMVVLDLVRQARPEVAVLFLDTGYHFPETYAYRDRVARAWGLNLVNLRAEQTVESQEAQYGKLYETQPNRCCDLRKVKPLLAGLAGYDVWFTGLRREQSPTRANLNPVEWHALPGGEPLLKVSPLAFWTWKEVWSYLAVNEIEPLPLYDQGYLSIGCRPCTSLPSDPENPRSGRWAGKKLECGIHTFNAPEAASAQ